MAYKIKQQAQGAKTQAVWAVYKDNEIIKTRLTYKEAQAVKERRTQ